MSYQFIPRRLTFTNCRLYLVNYMFYATHNATTVMGMCMCPRVGLWVERSSGNR
jgi:hypothetical protein